MHPLIGRDHLQLSHGTSAPSRVDVRHLGMTLRLHEVLYKE